MHNENKVPLIRLAKRDMMEPWKVWCIRLASIVLALLLGGLVMMIALPDGATPIDGYATIITGALGKKTAIRQTVKLAVPLLGCALAIAPCFKMRFWNIGAEGQITAGAIAASYFALYWVGKVPSAVLLLIMGLAGAVAGGIWALIPAFFKAKRNTNETLFTLMMNYIIIGVVRWLQGGPWEGRPGSQIIPQFDRAATLPKVLGVHCGWIIVLILVVFMHVYMNHTKHGYEISVVGGSENTARYAGIDVKKVTMRTLALSGAICGLAGFLIVAGKDQTIATTSAGGRGFTAAYVATQVFGDVFRALQIVADEWRVVVRAVVDDDDLEVVVGLLTQCGNQLIDIFSLVLAWHEYRHQRAVVVEEPPRQRTATMAAITCQKAVEEHTVLQDVVSRKLHEEEKPVCSHHIAHIESTQEVDEAADVV